MTENLIVRLMKEKIENFPTGYFAMVMATGIIGIAAHFNHIEWLALFLTIINIIFFIVLFILYALRILFFIRNVRNDLSDFSKGVGYFTVVAGTCILGNQFVIILDYTSVAIILLGFAVLLWLLLIYGIFAIYLVKEDKPTLEKGINGSWLVSIVATQAISILGGLLSSQFGEFQSVILFISLTLWLFGGMLYIWIIMLILQRYLFYKMEPYDLSPPYWINMGAVAITTLAGDVLIENAGQFTLLNSILPFLKGFTIFFWATATWWIPMLVILGIWRHIYKKFRLRYDSQYWSAVFPLGMYTVCTYRLANALNFDFLFLISNNFIYIAIAAWSAAFVGLVSLILKDIRNAVEAEHILS